MAIITEYQNLKLVHAYLTLQICHLIARGDRDYHEAARDIARIKEEGQRRHFDRGGRSVLASQRMHFEERTRARRFQGKRDYPLVPQLSEETWGWTHLLSLTRSSLERRSALSGSLPCRQDSYIRFPMSFWMSSIVSFSAFVTAFKQCRGWRISSTRQLEIAF